MDKLLEGKTYPAVIEGCVGDGRGVARIAGEVVFVQDALRGEEGDVLIEHVGHNAAWGRLADRRVTSSMRQAPDCPHYADCGGCCFRHMAYEEELEVKRLRVEDALRRLGGVNTAVSVIHGAENTWRYRNKVQFPVAGGAIGYYRGRSHQVVDIEDCLLQPERAAACRAAVLEWMEEFHVTSYEEKSHSGLVRHLYLRFNRAGETLCCLVVNGKSVPHADRLAQKLRKTCPGLAGLVLSENTARTNVVLGKSFRVLWGRDWLEEELCGLSFRLSVPSFFQVNRDQTEVLYTRALALAGLTGEETVLDLYCGIGTVSLCMAKRAKRVIGAELVPRAVEDAEDNARRNGLPNAEFFCGDAGAVAKRLASQGVRPDVVCVDPPRKGLAPEVPGILAGMGPERIVYISCDPATLARDAGRFGALGYRVRTAEAVDLFPRTGHVETIVLLRDQRSARDYVYVDYAPESSEYMEKMPPRATYPEIKSWVLENHGLKVSSLYISQVKRKHGLPVGESYNKPKAEDAKQPQCPPEKEAAIEAALRHFRLIP